MLAVPHRTQALTAREEEVLHHMAEGFTDKEIGRTLDISVYTVRNHVKSVLRKLNARNRTQAGAIYHRQNS
ncbi:MAG: LuxR C-terminal-related transcriptional regulator [Chloroflexota bacterium]